MSNLVQIIYISIITLPLSTSANAASWSSQYKQVSGKKVSIGYLNDETPASCGCFAWLDSKAQASGKLIYQELEANKQKYLNMKIDGVVINLIKDLPGESDKFLTAKPGIAVEEQLSGSGYNIVAKWKALKVTSPEEESARSATFEVDFKIKKKRAQKIFKAAGYCGC